MPKKQPLVKMPVFILHLCRPGKIKNEVSPHKINEINRVM